MQAQTAAPHAGPATRQVLGLTAAAYAAAADPRRTLRALKLTGLHASYPALLLKRWAKRPAAIAADAQGAWRFAERDGDSELIGTAERAFGLDGFDADTIAVDAATLPDCLTMLLNERWMALDTLIHETDDHVVDALADFERHVTALALIAAGAGFLLAEPTGIAA